MPHICSKRFKDRNPGFNQQERERENTRTIIHRDIEGDRMKKKTSFERYKHREGNQELKEVYEDIIQEENKEKAKTI